MEKHDKFSSEEEKKVAHETSERAEVAKNAEIEREKNERTRTFSLIEQLNHQFGENKVFEALDQKDILIRLDKNGRPTTVTVGSVDLAIDLDFALKQYGYRRKGTANAGYHDSSYWEEGIIEEIPEL